jgi:hypothetical protein
LRSFGDVTSFPIGLGKRTAESKSQKVFAIIGRKTSLESRPNKQFDTSVTAAAHYAAGVVGGAAVETPFKDVTRHIK